MLTDVALRNLKPNLQAMLQRWRLVRIARVLWLVARGRDGHFRHLQPRETERLVLRMVERSDAQDVFEIESDPEVQKVYAGRPHKSLWESRLFIERTLALARANFPTRWALMEKETNKVIGWCGFVAMRPPDEAECGCRLARSVWGKGYGPEALRAIFSYGFDVMGLRRITGSISAENTRSQKMADKVGLAKVGERMDQRLGKMIIVALERPPGNASVAYR